MQLVSDAYAVLGAIVEHAGGKPYWRSLRERVLDRAGMTETGVSYLTPLVAQRAAGYAQNFDGYTNAPHIGVTPAGGLYSTLRDLYAFDRALYGDTLVNEQSKARLFAVRRVITAYGWKTSEDTLPNGTRRRVLRTTGGLPGFEALMVRVPDARRTIILLSNVRTMVSRFDDFAIAIGRILDGRPYAMPKRSVAETLAASLTGGGSMTAIAREFDVMRADTARFALSESEINRLGYFFLSRGAPSRAADLFALTVRVPVESRSWLRARASEQDIEHAHSAHTAASVGNERQHRRTSALARLRTERLEVHRLERRSGIGDDRGLQRAILERDAHRAIGRVDVRAGVALERERRGRRPTRGGCRAGCCG